MVDMTIYQGIRCGKGLDKPIRPSAATGGPDALRGIATDFPALVELARRSAAAAADHAAHG